MRTPLPIFLHRRLSRTHLWITAGLAAVLCAVAVVGFDRVCRMRVRSELATLRTVLGGLGGPGSGTWSAAGTEAGAVLRTALGVGSLDGGVPGNTQTTRSGSSLLCGVRVLDPAGREVWAWPDHDTARDLQRSDLSFPGRSLRTDLYASFGRIWTYRWERAVPAGAAGGRWAVRLWFDVTPWLLQGLLPVWALLLVLLVLQHLLSVGTYRSLSRRLSQELTDLESRISALLEGAPAERLEGGRFALTQRMAGLLNRLVEHFSLRTRQVEITHQRDPLTGLYTRRYLMENMEAEIKRCKRYRRSMAFLMIDLDHFKRLNDEFGHQMGDQVLTTVGQVLRANTRETDLCARYGGEEIALILTETPLKQAVILAEKLRARIAAARVTFQGRTLHVTASFGVTSFLGGEEDSVEEIVKRADQALYEAKRAGRNLVRKAI